MKFELNKGVKNLLKVTGVLGIAGLIALCYFGANAEESILECKTNNFYYIYGIVDENTCILLKNTGKMTDDELSVVEDYEAESGETLEGLVMVDTAVSEEAKSNWMHSTTNMDVYGMQNTYLCQKGIGPFKHTFEKTMDVLYLTDNTAIKLGLLEGELPYEYVTMDDEGNMGEEAESSEGSIEDSAEPFGEGSSLEGSESSDNKAKTATGLSLEGLNSDESLETKTALDSALDLSRDNLTIESNSVDAISGADTEAE